MMGLPNNNSESYIHMTLLLHREATVVTIHFHRLSVLHAVLEQVLAWPRFNPLASQIMCVKINCVHTLNVLYQTEKTV